MKRQLQIKNGIAHSEWRGAGAVPVPPDDSWTFLDVTNRPEAQVGHTYNPATDTCAAPPPPPRTLTFYELLEAMTQVERLALRTLVGSNATAADTYEMLKWQGERPIAVDNPKLLTRLQQLVNAGVLTAARRDAILAGG